MLHVLHRCYMFCTGVTLFALVLHLNCTALSQSESRNFFMCTIILSNTWFHTCQYVQVNWDGTTKGLIMCLWYLSRWCVAFVVDILVIFPVPVTVMLLRAKMSSFVSSGISVLFFCSRATSRFTLYNKQPHWFCNHLKTKTLVLGIQDLLQRKRVEIC